MNTSTLNNYIKLFNSLVINSGFKRDIQDLTSTLPSLQNNIDVLRGHATKLHRKLEYLYGSDLPESLNLLFQNKVRPFTESPFDEDLKELIEDTQVNHQQFFQRLNPLISKLNTEIQSNIKETEIISGFITPYIDSTDEVLAEENKIVLSILFKEQKTITNLKEFTKNLQQWNKILPVYHQILSSKSPEDIGINGIQEGSIDLIVNLNVDIGLDLTELFTYGFNSFIAYLSYKRMIKPIISTYNGNKALIESEKTREQGLLDNIGEAVYNQILNQHKKALKTDAKIDKNIDKKVEQVTKLVTAHIIKGNDLKIVALPSGTGDDNEKKDDSKEELNTVSSAARQALKNIPQKEMKLLLAKYPFPEDEKKKM